MSFPEVISLCMKNWFQHFFYISVFYEWQPLQFLLLLKSFQNFPYNIFMYTSHVVLHLFWLFVQWQWYKLVLEKKTQTLFFPISILSFTLLFPGFQLWPTFHSILFCLYMIFLEFSKLFRWFSYKLNITFSDLYYCYCIFY